MKLYYSPGACSLASHIVAEEAHIAVQLEKVDLKNKTTGDGSDYFKVNEKGAVPALLLDSGEVLTEGPAIMQYLADSKPDANLVPPAGTLGRYRLQEMLGFLNSEVHKSYSPLFNPKITEAGRGEAVANLQKRYRWIDRWLGVKPFLVGDSFSVADAYLYTVTRWADLLHLDLSAFTTLLDFQKRIGARPAVKTALAAEGLEPVA